MKTKIAIFAGTQVDCFFGAQLVNKKGFEAITFPFSKTPKEQTDLQYFSKAKLKQLFVKKIQDAKNLNAQKIFLYCNSLSAAVDYQKISFEQNIEIISPLESYARIVKNLSAVAILAANALSAYTVEKIITKAILGIKTISIANLSIVEAIESKKTPEQIVLDLGLKNLLSYLQEIQSPAYKISHLILACTHFPYIKDELQKHTALTILSPEVDMLDRLG